MMSLLLLASALLLLMAIALTLALLLQLALALLLAQPLMWAWTSALVSALQCRRKHAHPDLLHLADNRSRLRSSLSGSISQLHKSCTGLTGGCSRSNKPGLRSTNLS